MKHRKSLTWNSSAVFISRISDVISGLAMMILLTRYLGPSKYGEYVWLITAVMICQPLIHFELDKILMRDLSDRALSVEIIQNRFATMMGLKVGLVLLFLILMLGVVVVMPIPLLWKKPLLLLSAGQSCFQLWLGYVALARAVEQMEFEAVFTLGYRLVLPLAVAITAWQNLGFTAVFFCFFIADLGLVISASLLFSTRFFPITITFKATAIRYYLRQASPLVISALSMILFLRVDIPLIRVLSGVDETAYFHIPHNVLLQLTIIPTALVTAVLPLLSRAIHTHNDSMHQYIRSWEMVMFLFSAFISTFLFMAAPEIITLLAGPNYDAAIPNLRILSVAYLSLFFSQFYTALLIAEKLQRRILWSTLLTLLLAVILDLLLVPKLGAWGASIGKSAAYFFYCFALFRASDVRQGNSKYSQLSIMVIGIVLLIANILITHGSFQWVKPWFIHRLPDVSHFNAFIILGIKFLYALPAPACVLGYLLFTRRLKLPRI